MLEGPEALSRRQAEVARNGSSVSVQVIREQAQAGRLEQLEASHSIRGRVDTLAQAAGHVTNGQMCKEATPLWQMGKYMPFHTGGLSTRLFENIVQ